jgi:hypothetical protein
LETETTRRRKTAEAEAREEAKGRFGQKESSKGCRFATIEQTASINMGIDRREMAPIASD